ncbi:MarR family winged helix-turn-helix transcriptional regulator [Flexivirga meconopsidis]|uniref:MarR family winged helix-turn-helix transcriptional regulator n=1 Tax=Flexivirga meconopsidis TaxID=2977121 RepID=UPI00223EC69D|nr:MarR family transcriptional regulator [Flexivirga meconopsidis]
MTSAERRKLAGDLRSVVLRMSRRIRFSGEAILPPHQATVLLKLDKEVLTPRQLAQIECVSAPSMTRTVSALVDQGLVRREDDPDDGRQVRLHLTRDGRARLADIRRSREEWMRSHMGGLSDEECAVLREAVDILERVVTAR